MYFTKYNKLILVLIGLVVLFCLLQVPKLKADFNFRDFLLDNDPELDFFEEINREFGSDNELLLIGIQNHETIYNTTFLNNLQQFTKDCHSLNYIQSAYSIATANDYLRTPLGVFPVPLIHINNAAEFKADSIRICNDERMHGWLVSEDAKSATVVVQTVAALNDNEKASLVTKLDSLVEKSGFETVHIAGNLNTEVRYVRMIEKELGKNTLFCSLVIVVFLLLAFNTWQGIILPALSVLSAMVIFYGGLSLFKQHFNVLSTLFPTILLIVGISGLIHFFSKFYINVKSSSTITDAVIVTYKELVLPLFITAFTTAIGFFSLVTAPVRPIRVFGMETGIAVMLAFGLSLLLVPCFLVMRNNYRQIFATKRTFNWDWLLSYILLLTRKKSGHVVAVTVFVVAISVIGIQFIDTNSFILNNFSEKTDLKKGFQFFEQNFSGVRSLKIVVSPQNGRTINHLEVLREIEKLQLFLVGRHEIGSVFSPVTRYKTLNSIYYGSLQYRLPESQKVIERLDRLAKQMQIDKAYPFINANSNRGLMIAKTGDIGSDKATQLNKSIDQWICNNIDTSLVRHRYTGIWHLSDKSNNSLARNMVVSLLLAFMVVGAVMAFLFTNIKFVIVSLIPNIIPLVVAAGVMGFANITFNAPTTVVFTIGIVIAVDDTVHFLSKFKKEMVLHNNFELALTRTMHETGKGIIITTIVLFFGFLVLVNSDMKEVFYQGILFCTLLVSAVLSDLLLIPILLRRLYHKEA